MRNMIGEKKETILNFFGDECIICSSKENLVIHHIISIKRGGTNTLYNLCVLCEKHHKQFHFNKDKSVLTLLMEIITKWKKTFWESSVSQMKIRAQRTPFLKLDELEATT